MRPSSILAFRGTALLGLAAVALGAAGAHGRAVHDVLVRLATSEFWEKAVFYHFIHVAVMLLVCCLQPFPRLAWSLFLAGITAFSGSLYAYAMTTAHWLVYVTPFGGLFLLAGWLSLCAVKRNDGSFANSPTSHT